MSSSQSLSESWLDPPPILRLANGGFYLFQAADEEQMELWVNGINREAHPPQEVEGTKSQTLPPGSEKKDEPKRRSFFTLKKK